MPIMNLFGPKMGTWIVESKKDPKWNKTGRAVGLIWEGGPKEMQAWIKECKEKYGSPPDDCVASFYKD